MTSGRRGAGRAGASHHTHDRAETRPAPPCGGLHRPVAVVSPPKRTRDEGLRYGVVALGVGFVLLGQHGEVHFEPRMVGGFSAFDGNAVERTLWNAHEALPGWLGSECGDPPLHNPEVFRIRRVSHPLSIGLFTDAFSVSAVKHARPHRRYVAARSLTEAPGHGRLHRRHHHAGPRVGTTGPIRRVLHEHCMIRISAGLLCDRSVPGLSDTPAKVVRRYACERAGSAEICGSAYY